jgi:hypothetical protein
MQIKFTNDLVYDRFSRILKKSDRGKKQKSLCNGSHKDFIIICKICWFSPAHPYCAAVESAGAVVESASTAAGAGVSTATLSVVSVAVSAGFEPHEAATKENTTATRPNVNLFFIDIGLKISPSYKKVRQVTQCRKNFYLRGYLHCIIV